MARFKKKKSKPTPEPGSTKVPSETSIEKPGDAPPNVGDSVSPPQAPPDDSKIEGIRSAENTRKLNLLYWLRVILAVTAGIVATFIFEDIEGEDKRWASIGFMIIIFLGTIVVAKNMKMQLASSDRKKVVTQAIGSYVFLYLFTWIVTHTIVNAGIVSGGINV